MTLWGPLVVGAANAACYGGIKPQVVADVNPGTTFRCHSWAAQSLFLLLILPDEVEDGLAPSVDREPGAVGDALGV